MCSKKFVNREFRTPFGIFTGKDVKDFLKDFSKIIKAVVARGLYGVYTLLVVWRVTVALQDPLYWLLLFCITLIGLEAIHTIIARNGGEPKWVTPSVFFYLVCAVPSIWLLELKLLSDRQREQNANSTNSDLEATNSVINLNLSDEGWTLAIEQILIFVLIFGKWIAPKGELTLDQLSQLLLVNLGTGADIIELLETFNEDEVKVNSEIVYLIMSIWSWSLLQFCIVPTAYKELPDIEEPIDVEARDYGPCSSTTDSAELGESDFKSESQNADGKDSSEAEGKKANKGKQVLRSQSEGVAKATSNRGTSNGKHIVKVESEGVLNTKGRVLGSKNNKVGSCLQSEGNQNNVANGINKNKNGKEIPSAQENGRTPNEDTTDRKMKIETREGASEEDLQLSSWDHSIIAVHDEEDDLKLDDNVSGWLAGKRCCICFCCYTEIWGMILSLMFQDVPFLITRLFIMLHYGVVSHMTVFFTFKNVVIILLLLNRIRVVVLEERKPWKKHMREVTRVGKRNEEIVRENKRVKMRSEDEKRSPVTTNGDIEVSLMTQEDDLETANAAQATASRRKTWSLRKPKWKFWRT